MPNVSILIPTKNRSWMFKRCLDSCVNQTYHDIEIIIVDCSDEKDAKENKEHVDKIGSEKVKYYLLPRDPGFIPSWYTCASYASGTMARFVLDDDWLNPNSILNEIRLIEQGSNWTICQARIHHENNKPSELNFFDIQGIATGIYPCMMFEQYMMSLPMTITPSCVMMPLNNVLDHLYTGKIPYVSKRTTSNDCFMVCAMFSMSKVVGWVSEENANLFAHSNCCTIAAMETKEKTEAFCLEYAQIKAAYKTMKSGL